MAENNVRNSFLSSWAVNSENQFSFAESRKENERSERKVGFVFCRKCYEVVASTEIKCPHCGRVMK